jgi:hypothetical protein
MVMGEPKSMVVNVNKNLVDNMAFNRKILDNYEQSHALWKAVRKNPQAREAAYLPGGTFDPVVIEADKVAERKRRIDSLRNDITERYSDDEFNQYKAKKSADKAESFVTGIEDIFSPQKGVASHFSDEEIKKRVRGGMSRSDFMTYIRDLEQRGLVDDVPDMGDMAEVLDPKGSGMAAVRSMRSGYKKSAKKIQAQIDSQMPKGYVSPIDELINKRAKK